MTDWATIVRQHAEIVHRTVYRLVGNHADAWDCVQETFLDAVRVDRRAAVRNWPGLLRRLATARALDLLRVRIRRRGRLGTGSELDNAVSMAPGPVDLAETSELAGALRMALSRLPRRQAEVFCLACFDEMDSTEIAEQLAIRPAAVRMLLLRARRRLQQLLKSFAGEVKCDL